MLSNQHVKITSLSICLLSSWKLFRCLKTLYVGLKHAQPPLSTLSDLHFDAFL